MQYTTINKEGIMVRRHMEPFGSRSKKYFPQLTYWQSNLERIYNDELNVAI